METGESVISLQSVTNCNFRFEKRLAVQINDGNLSYGFRKSATRALDGVNLAVPEGVIYGLLGPSGCGKTTLLSTVVGLLKLKSGTVKVFGQTPGTSNSIVPGRGVGYMPQEMCLFQELSIEETLRYFGRLQRLSQSSVNERTDFLIKFLDLPKKTKIVGNLSGGQQRRVSLAVALIHKPPLLILDEPTVGVDPLLRQCIWDYLLQLTSEGITVIVTTHYIEEARQAHMVGLMRDGKLLAETSPDRLLTHFGETTLEKCFLVLCKINKFIDLNTETFSTPKSQETGHLNKGFSDDQDIATYSASNSTVDLESFKPTTLSNQIPEKTVTDFWFTLFVLVWKNITRNRRNLLMIVFELIVPAFVVVFMCYCVGPQMHGMPMAVVNEENPVLFSKMYLDKIDPYVIIQKPADNLEDALASVRNGSTYGSIYIRKGFSKAILQKFKDGAESSNETIFNGSITVNMDNTNQQVVFALSSELSGAFQKFSRSALEETGANALLADSPVHFEDPVFGNTDVTYTQYVAPGVIINIVYFFGMTLTALSCVEERKSGMFARSRVSGVSGIQVLLSQMIAHSFVLCLQVVGCIAISIFMLQISPQGSMLWLVLITLLEGVFGMAFGLVISVVVTDENFALLLAIGTYYPVALLSGFLWPIEGQPDFLRYWISEWLPQTMPSIALRDILYKGFDITYYTVWFAMVIESVWTILAIITGILVLRLRM